MSQERRESERQPFLDEIMLEFSSGKREARVSDISMGGCYVDSIAGVTEGEPVSFDMSTGDGTSLAFTGEVAYVFPGMGFGIKFTNITEEQRLFLEGVTSR
ncbi:MAG TPA: PilZ domain-containing protein [Pyrinomonadaceae bacterium]|nr:PilZ domain-containing protein [Pyrinomonadaceae bacterium]